jgi:ketosteroid isomerase-like protein
METLTDVKQDNIVIVRNAFSDFLNGNIPGVLEACTDDVVWGSYDNPTIPYASMYRGKNGVAEFFSNLGGSVDYENFETKSYYGDHDMVFVTGNHRGKVKSTGKKFGHDFLMQFRLREGKVSNFFAWVDSRDQANAFDTQSSSRTETVNQLYQYFFQGDIPAVVELMTDDMKWDATRNPVLPEPKVYNGKAEVFEFFKQVNDLMTFKSFTPVHSFEKDGAVYVNGNFEIEMKKTGENIKLDWTMRWRFRGEKICGFAEYFAPAEKN